MYFSSLLNLLNSAGQIGSEMIHNTFEWNPSIQSDSRGCRNMLHDLLELIDLGYYTLGWYVKIRDVMQNFSRPLHDNSYGGLTGIRSCGLVFQQTPPP